MMTASTAIKSLRPPTCVQSPLTPFCPRASDHDINVLLSGFFIMAIGAAGVKAVVPPFGQEQFDVTDQAEKRSGTHFFNW